MQSAGAVAERRDRGDDGDDDWPICEKVLRSLSEDVRPTAATANDDNSNEAAVVANVQLCLAERVVPMQVERPRPRQSRERRQLPHLWRPSERDPVQCSRTIVAAVRTQTRLMTIRSAYADGKYYAPGTPHVSRTVEELSLWPAAKTPDNSYTYTAGTVLYDSDTGACYLHGFADPRSRVAVRCDLLTTTLPRHGRTVKVFAVLQTPTPGDAPVLVLQHFQVFSRAGALFR